jgi:hypothetical protein
MSGANFYEKAQFVKTDVATAPGLTQLLCPSRYASITLGGLTLSLVARCIMGSVLVQATKEVLRSSERPSRRPPLVPWVDQLRATPDQRLPRADKGQVGLGVFAPVPNPG